MTRTVIGLQGAGSSVFVSLDRAPAYYEGDGAQVNLETLANGTLIDRGRAILELITADEPVRSGLAAALANPVGSPPSPLYFHVRASAADAIEWEQIYKEPHGFCALDTRWPVGRIAKFVRDVKGRAFTKPFRIVAVLSAARRDGQPQLAALAEAVAASPIDAKLHVISGDADIVARAGEFGATAELIAGKAPDLCKQIGGARPHLVHLLCHGGATAGVRTLAFADIADVDEWKADNRRVDNSSMGSLRLSVASLVEALNACDPWLVVLAACETADAASVANGRALAHDLVSTGVTAVIGMRRVVDLRDTDRFCRALYPEVLATVQAAISPPGGDATEAIIDWACTLTNPRKVMSGVDPSAASTWLDPVLYAQNDPLRVFPAAEPAPVGAPAEPAEQLSSLEYAELQGKRDKYGGYLATIDPETASPGLLDEVQARIADIEQRLAQAGG